MSQNLVKKGNKPIEAKSTIDFHTLCEENIQPYLLPDSLQKASKDSALLKGSKVADLFDLDKLIEWKPNEIEIHFSRYLPKDIIKHLVYERRREQKLYQRKQREANERKEQRYLNKLERERGYLLLEKSALIREINNYRYHLGEDSPNYLGQGNIQQFAYPKMQEYIQPIYPNVNFNLHCMQMNGYNYQFPERYNYYN